MYYDINNGILDALYANPLERPIDETIKKCLANIYPIRAIEGKVM